MQPTIEHAIEAGRRGMELAADRADRDDPGWTEVALEALRECVSHVPFNEEFIIEELRARIGSMVSKPQNLRAWGQVTQMAIRRKVIVPTGGFGRAASSHGSPKPLYRRGSGEAVA